MTLIRYLLGLVVLTVLFMVLNTEIAIAQNRYLDSSLTTPFESLRTGEVTIAAPYCHDVNPRYDELTTSLETLRESIRKDANCQDQAAKLGKFSQIVEKARPQFLELIKKAADQPLTPKENKTITSYLESLTTTGGELTELAAGSSCFDDDRKNDLSIEVVATLVQEASAVVGSFVGPSGALVAVGGRATATLMVGIDKIIRSRRAYDFSEPNQRKVFIKTMCSYAASWDKFDRISHTDDWLHRLQRFHDTRKLQIEGMAKNCEECKQIAQQFARDFDAKDMIVFEPPAKIAEKYKDLVTKADARFQAPFGTSVVGALSDMAASIKWGNDLQYTINDMGDVERDRVVQMQNTIEDFFFLKWMPEFIEYYQTEVQSRYRELRSYLYEQAGRMFVRPVGRHRIAEIDELWPVLFNPKPDTHKLFRTERDRTDYLESAKSEARQRLTQLVSAQLVIERHCQFVRAARLKYHRGMNLVCDGHYRQFTENLYGQLYRLYTNQMQDSAVLRSLFEVASPTMMDWAASRNLPLPNPEIRWAPTWLDAQVELAKEVDFSNPLLYPLKPTSPEP